VSIDDKRLSLIIFLVRLDILGMRKVRHNLTQHMMAGHGTYPQTPLCAIELAITGLSKDYIEFVIKKNHPGEEWMDLGGTYQI